MIPPPALAALLAVKYVLATLIVLICIAGIIGAYRSIGQ